MFFTKDKSSDIGLEEKNMYCLRSCLRLKNMLNVMEIGVQHSIFQKEKERSSMSSKLIKIINKSSISVNFWIILMLLWRYKIETH